MSAATKGPLATAGFNERSVRVGEGGGHVTTAPPEIGHLLVWSQRGVDLT